MLNHLPGLSLRRLLVLVTLASTVLTYSSSAGAAGGEGISGGGNGMGVSEADVRDLVIQVNGRLPELLSVALLNDAHVLNPKNVKIERVKKVLQAWFDQTPGKWNEPTWLDQPAGKGNEPIFNDIYGSKYFTQSADCSSGTAAHNDASTALQRNAPICFSTARLARYPRLALWAQLFALAAHEHAHHFGFGEEDAQALQAYIIDAWPMIETQVALFGFYIALNDFRKHGASAENKPEEICTHMAQISMYLYSSGVDSFIAPALRPQTICEPTHFDPDKVEKAIRRAEADAIARLNYQ